ncbi:zona pellucida sperm-binding protein 4-like [Scyliorhinus canicula]|uniref:zona pellucida sperm-binding protein 4-like n=1 Tax=Scyliorhinus canicula TaxID=7830 RepID=UPI0018F55DA4|nr:zona pellucida sperm-binding protein 4-like [Scyliorhinus canicula]
MGRWLGVWSLCLLAGSLLAAQPPLLGNDVCVAEPGWRFECGHSGVSSTECSRQGCCFDPQSSSHHPCFYNLRKSPVCTADGQFLIVISKNLTRPALNLSSLYVKDGQEAECTPKLTTAQFVTFHFPITSCGSSKREEDGSLIYETDVFGKRMIQTGKLGSITRDSTFSLHVQCKYTGSQETGLLINVTVYTVSPPPPASEDGILELELRIAKGGDYSSWYVDSDYPIRRILQEPVFVEVRVLDRTDPMIVLRLHDCWATPIPAPDHEVQWSLLVDGCSYEGDDYQTLLHPVGVFSGLKFPTHHKWFEVKTFVFLDGELKQPLSGQVYLHCSAEVCSPSSQDDCTPKCGAEFFGPKRRRSISDHKGTLVSAPGPIFLGDDLEAKKLHEANGAAESPSWVLQGVSIGLMMLSLSLLVVAAMFMKRPRAVTSRCNDIEL